MGRVGFGHVEMIQRETRDDLANCLQRLLAGEMTNREFDDRYYERWLNSEDAAVTEIARFGWGLYSDPPPTYRLGIHYSVPDEAVQTGRRAILFLRTDLEYQWPRNVAGVVPYWGLYRPGCYLLVGMILLFVGGVDLWLEANGRRTLEGLGMSILGLLAVTPTIHWLLTHRKRADEVRQFRRSGDFTVWPFLRLADFDRARHQQANP
jgi:hypothetical protein